MKTCEHEYENANCTNCANGLPILAYECAKTKGELKEYCHNKAEEIHKQIIADVIDAISKEIDRLDSQGGGIDDLRFFLKQLKEKNND